MATENQESQRLSQTTSDEPCFFVPPTFESLRSPQPTDAIITIDDEEDETLVSKDKKRDNIMIPPIFDSSGSLPSTDATIIIDDKYRRETLESKMKKKKPKLGSWWDEVEALNELSMVVKGLPKPKNNDGESRVDPSSTDLHEKKKVDERSLSSSSSHHTSFVDLSEGENSVGEITSRNKGNGCRHVSLEELGVSLEDLKSLPWEAFDPTWEIRSETMDPWLGGYIQDMHT